jgi:hypothetical protein
MRFAFPTFLLSASFAFFGCSSQTSMPVEQEIGTLRCCNGGVVYQCANVAAQDRCNAGSDTVDCTKTSETCGGGGASDAGGTTDMGSTDTGSADTGAKVPETGTPKKPFGALCGDPSDCEDGLCLTIGAGTTGTCSRPCAGVSDCPTKHVCELVGKLGIRACVAKGEKKIGEPCANQFDCESMICIGTETDAYCTAGCAISSECPAGWTCAVISGGGKYCVR